MLSFVRVRRSDGAELTIDLMELEEALQRFGPPGQYYLLLKSGRIIFPSYDDTYEEDEVEEVARPADEEVLPIDEIGSRDRFGWMEEFADTVRSLAAQNALRDALRRKKPFRNFKGN